MSRGSVSLGITLLANVVLITPTRANCAVDFDGFSLPRLYIVF